MNTVYEESLKCLRKPRIACEGNGKILCRTHTKYEGRRKKLCRPNKKYEKKGANLCIPNKIYEEADFFCDFLIKPVREQVLGSKKGFQGNLSPDQIAIRKMAWHFVIQNAYLAKSRKVTELHFRQKRSGKCVRNVTGKKGSERNDWSC